METMKSKKYSNKWRESKKKATLIITSNRKLKKKSFFYLFFLTTRNLFVNLLSSHTMRRSKQNATSSITYNI